MPPRKTREFRTADLVFAKIKGYPPWPARVEKDLPTGFKPTPGRYPVFFFGTYETAVVAAKDLYPYEQYKHQFGIKRKMKNFNEGLEEIEQTPLMTMDSENLIKIREERASQSIDTDENSASDASFQRSDGNSSDSSSNKSLSDSSSSVDNKKKTNKNGKSKSALNKSNKKLKAKGSNSDSDSDSEVAKPKTKSAKSKKNGSLKEKVNRKDKASKKSFLLHEKESKKGKSRKRIKVSSSDSEASKSSIDDQHSGSDSENLSPKEQKSAPRHSDNSDGDVSKSPATKPESGNEKMSDVNNDSDSEEATRKEKKNTKRTRIDSESDSDGPARDAKSPKNDKKLDEVIKLKHKLHNEKLALKLEEKEREKERRKREKMEQKRLERIKKPHDGDAEGTSGRTIGETLTLLNQSIKSSLSINNANVEKCLEAMENIDDLKITSHDISNCSNQFKELIQTLKKCKKYKSDQRVRAKADICLTKFRKLYTGDDADHSKGEYSTALSKNELEDPSEVVATTEQQDSNLSTEEHLHSDLVAETECTAATPTENVLAPKDEEESKESSVSSNAASSTRLEECNTASELVPPYAIIGD